MKANWLTNNIRSKNSSPPITIHHINSQLRIPYAQWYSNIMLTNYDSCETFSWDLPWVCDMQLWRKIELFVRHALECLCRGAGSRGCKRRGDSECCEGTGSGRSFSTSTITTSSWLCNMRISCRASPKCISSVRSRCEWFLRVWKASIWTFVSEKNM